jgi:hypothetical protein
MSECFDRKELIRKKIQVEEEAERIATGDARELVGEFLRAKKGYLPEDIETDREFVVRTGSHEDTVSVDYIVRLKGKRYMAIKCSMSLESRERHVVSFSRVADSVQIPYCVVTDGIKAYLIETVSGKKLSEEMDALPSREEAMGDMEAVEFEQYPPEKAEKEKRILLAFECTSCPREQI